MDNPFVWLEEQQFAFETMATAVAIAPILRHFNHKRHLFIEADGTEYVSARAFSQYDDEGVLHYVAYYLKKHTPAKCNYDIYYHHPMVIIKALEEWRPECEGATHPLQLLTDHKNLQYFMTEMLLNQRQTHWSKFSTQIDNQLICRAGKCIGKADAVMRRPGDLSERGDERWKNMEQLVLKL